MNAQFVCLCLAPLLAMLPTGRALVLEEPRPGALPMLTPGPENLPGGKTTFDLNDRERYDFLEHLVQIALDLKQAKDRMDNVPNYVQHKLTKITGATHQIVAGKLYEVKFFVGEKDCATAHPKRGCLTKTDGQFGECFFEILTHLGDKGAEIRRAICIKSTKEQAAA